MKGTALITGASAGIGAVYADRLARRGYDLVLVARKRDRLETLQRRLTEQTGRSIEVVVADLTNCQDIRRVEDVLRSNTSISMLVNNAGVGSIAPLLNAAIDTMEEMIALNVSAPTRLTYAAAPGFVARGGGTIVNISAIGALTPGLTNGVYDGTKAFLLSFGASLEHELGGKGVRVQTVVPGPVATEFWDVAGVGLENVLKQWTGAVISAQDLVDAALAGLDQGEVVTLPSLPDMLDWDAFQTARQAVAGNLAHEFPARRYEVTLRQPD
jgi:hypothetical protein